MNNLTTFKISPIAMSVGAFTSSIVYLTVSNSGEFTAFLADNSIKLTGMVGSSVIKIVYGDVASTVTSVASTRLGEYIKTNIKTGSQLTAIGASALTGFVAILLTVILEYLYSKTKNYLSNKQVVPIEIKESDFLISNVDDFEIINYNGKNI